MNPLLAIALAAAQLASPPMRVDWVAAGIGPVPSRTGAACGFERGQVLVVIATQTATDGMIREEREALDEAAERLEAGWAEADQRGRARLVLDHLAASKNSQRIVSQSWVVLDGMPVTLVYVFDSRSGNLFFRIRDEVTGAWAACTAQPRDESDHEQTRERIRELLASENEGEKTRILKDMMQDPSVTELRYEVNGEVLTLDSAGVKDWAARKLAFIRLWPSLAPPEGRARVETALAILGHAVDDNGLFRDVGRSRIFPDLLPESTDHFLCPGELPLSFVDGVRPEDGLFAYSLPPQDVTRELFGDEPLPMPDPGLGWKALMKQLR
ncbi:MAG TPA: hypothetical protein VLT32_14160 [Candidatus Sulfomarinibacteraceae bacterium]|nr:hypothetical protein [Candidatus Sulfomarinibacteraceae bacterium]